MSGWSGVWPRIFDNCHCDRETVSYIEETGFGGITISDFYAFYPTKKELAMTILMYFVRRFVLGRAIK